MYTSLYTYHMQHKTPARVSKKQFLGQVEALWPALKGSLAQVRKPCIRPLCPACASGEKHLAFLLAFTHHGRRRCMYVPQSFVSQMRKALDNGRRLEALLYQIGPSLLQEYREQRAASQPIPLAKMCPPKAPKPQKSRKN